MIYLLLCLLLPPPDRIMEAPPARIEVEHNYRWVVGTGHDQMHLYDGKIQVGTWLYSKGLYYPFDGEKWGDPFVYPKGRVPDGAPRPPAKPQAIMQVQPVLVGRSC